MTLSEPQDNASLLDRIESKGYHQSWYPIALSSEVSAGQVIGKELFEGRVVVWRGEDGVARVQSAFCRHLGADMSLGEVAGNALRCVFHHWEYGVDGRCTRIPVSDTAIPAAARLFNFPVAEAWGLVWLFNGEEPLFDPPTFTNIPSEQVAHRVFETDPLPVPPYIILANTHDFQHVAVVHGATMASEPQEFLSDDYTISFENQVVDPTLGPAKQFFKIFGVNSLCLENRFEKVRLFSMFSCTPINDGLTKGYTVTGTVNAPGAPVEMILNKGEHFAREIMEDDNAVLKTIRFKIDMPIVADRPLMRWLKRAAEFPTAHPSRAFIA